MALRLLTLLAVAGGAAAQGLAPLLGCSYNLPNTMSMASTAATEAACGVSSFSHCCQRIPADTNCPAGHLWRWCLRVRAVPVLDGHRGLRRNVHGVLHLLCRGARLDLVLFIHRHRRDVPAGNGIHCKPGAVRPPPLGAWLPGPGRCAAPSADICRYARPAQMRST